MAIINSIMLLLFTNIIYFYFMGLEKSPSVCRTIRARNCNTLCKGTKKNTREAFVVWAIKSFIRRCRRGFCLPSLLASFL